MPASSEASSYRRRESRHDDHVGGPAGGDDTSTIPSLLTSSSCPPWITSCFSIGDGMNRSLSLELIEARRVLAAAANLCDVPRLKTVLATEFFLIRNLTFTTGMSAFACLLWHKFSPSFSSSSIVQVRLG